MRTAYRVVAIAISALVVLQAALVAWGAFALLSQLDDGLDPRANSMDPLGLELHAIGGMVTFALALLLLVLGVLVKVPGAARWGAIVFAVTLLQYGLAEGAGSLPALGLLHGAGAFAVAAVAGLAARVVRTVEPVTA